MLKSLVPGLICLVLVFNSVGCNVNSKLDYVNNARQLTWAVNGCAIAVPILAKSGRYDVINTMDTTVHIGYNCSLSWFYYLNEPNFPSPDIACAQSTLIELISLETKYIDQNEPSMVKYKATKPATLTDVNDFDVLMAKRGLDNAVINFDLMVDISTRPEKKKYWKHG